MDRNQHVKDYLTYYTDFSQPPHYAVMLNGPWGIGKTFLVDLFLEPLKERGLKVVYVSLYGVLSFEEIDDAIFRAVYPLLDNKATKIAARLAKSAGKFFRIETDLKTADLLNRADADLFVFDDLERCEISINRVLGYINEFVEHEDRKVIIIANEAEISNQDSYRRIREKLIGKTLEIQSALEEALTAFIALIQDDVARNFLSAKSETIVSLYDQSELHNLRILQQTMWDFERLYMALNDEHRNSELAMTALLKLLFALSIEFKAGRLSRQDLLNRKHSTSSLWTQSRREGELPSPFSVAQARYVGVKLSDRILSDETLTALLVKGIVDLEAVRADLDASSFFLAVADEPAWRTVASGYERTDEQFQAALDRMERAFAAREFVIPGEVMQVFGLRLWLSKIDAIAPPRPQVVEECKNYIDDLYKAERIEAASSDEDFSLLVLRGYCGFAFYEAESEEFRELSGYYQEKQQTASVDKYPHIADELLSKMVHPDDFLKSFNLINGETNDLYRKPVLAAVDPDKFVAALLALHPAGQRTIFVALKARYENGNLDRYLASERLWAGDVRQKIADAANKLSPISRERLRAFNTYGLDPFLGTKSTAMDRQRE